MKWVCLAVLLLALGVRRVVDRFYSSDLRITVFDVGQGDSALVRFPGGKAWLIDAGGGWKDWDRGQRELFLELARYGILTLDAGILSHPDTDHGLGFRGLFGQIHFREFWYNAATPVEREPLLALLLGLAERHGTRPRAFSGVTEFREGGVDVQTRALPPPPARWTRRPSRRAPSTNDSPLVVRLHFRGCSFLFAGDAEKRAEATLAKTTPPTTVLKVNHHGSRTSSHAGFLAAVQPRWAIASVGARNLYGHPAPDVVRRFAERRTRWLQTDVQGFVEFTVTAAGEIRCRSAQGECGVERCAEISRW